MTRARGVKPDLLRHEGLLDLEASTGLPVRLCFIALLMACDRAGRFQWRPRTLKAELMPLDEGLDFERILHLLEHHGDFLRQYSGPDGKRYGWIPAFTRHQNINPREPQSVLPPHPDEAAYYSNYNQRTENQYYSTRAPRVPHASVTVTADSSHACPTDVEIDSTRDDACMRKGKERNRKGIGKEGEEERNGAPPPAAPPDGLINFQSEAGTEEKKEGPPGTPEGHMAERIVRTYPANGRFYDAVRAVLGVLNAGRDADDLMARVKLFADRWRALPERERAYCPGLHTFFEQAAYDQNPDAHPWVFAKPDTSGNGSGPPKKNKAPAGPVESARLEAARSIWPDMAPGTRWLDLTPEQRDRVLATMKPEGKVND